MDCFPVKSATHGTVDRVYIYIYCIICSYQTSTGDLQERLREAAKARIRRMCQAHKKKAQYNVPQFVVEQWENAEAKRNGSVANGLQLE